VRTAAVTWLVVFWMAFSPTWAREATTADDVREGHFLAITLCSTCHVAGADQPEEPIMQPPAPSFESIAQRKDVNAASLQNFINTTHRGLDNPKGMPNPSLPDYEVKPVVSYILSLRK
jgi:mono/diheme cytochrome c family protein